MVQKLLRVGLSGIIILAGVVLLIHLADRAAGWWKPEPWPQHGLIFPPDSTIVYASSEFEATAHINGLGFRGGRVERERSPGTVRILAIGDSFTFGYGVEDHETWPYLLEEALRSLGYAVEVFNLGVPGGAIPNYLEIAERAIPFLKPDIVLVGLLQIGDLVPESSMRLDGPMPDTRSAVFQARVDNLLRGIAPNIYFRSGRFVGRPPQEWSAETFRASYRQQFRELLEHADEEMRLHIEGLPDDIRLALEEGNLNPVSVSTAEPLRFFVEYLVTSTDPDPMIESALRMGRARLKRIDRLARRHGAQFALVTLPSMATVYPDGLSFYSSVFQREPLPPAIMDSLLSGDRVESIMIRLADSLDVPVCSLQEPIRVAVQDAEEPLYFLMDGHPTAAGYRQFVESIASFLVHLELPGHSNAQPAA